MNLPCIHTIPVTSAGPLSDKQDRAIYEAAKPFETERDMSWDEIAGKAEEAGEHHLAALIRSYYTWGC